MPDSSAESMTDVILDLAGSGPPGTPAMAIRLVRRYARGCWHWYLGFAVATIVGAIAGLIQPAVLSMAIDDAATGSGLSSAVGVFALLTGLGTLTTFLAGRMQSRFEGTVAARTTHDAAGHALLLGLPGRRPFEHGDLMSRVAGDANAVAGYPAFVMTVAMGTATAALGAVALALLDWALLVAFLAVAAGLFVFGARFFSQTFVGERDLRDLSAHMTQRYLDALAGRRSIRAARTVANEVARITKPLPQICATGRDLLALYGLGGSLMFAAQLGMLVAIVAVGGWSLSVGRISAGELVAATQYATLAFGSVMRIFDYGWFQLAIVQARSARVMELLDAPHATPAPAARRDVPRGDGNLVFEQVSVLGEPACVLVGLDLVVPAGSTVAIVGESGAGKSTIAALAGRLLDPDAGRVAIDGVDVATLSRRDLSELVAYAFERPALLGGTIRGSIALGVAASDAEVRAAARVAEADSWIERLADGYDTRLGDAPMSGGERQRLGLARAALRRPRILVLDDALSSLDTATEAKVFEAFRMLTIGRTTVVVAHRASTAARADLVVWLTGGTVRAVGTHRDLWGDNDYRAAFMSDQARSPSPGHAPV